MAASVDPTERAATRARTAYLRVIGRARTMWRRRRKHTPTIEHLLEADLERAYRDIHGTTDDPSPLPLPPPSAPGSEARRSEQSIPRCIDRALAITFELRDEGYAGAELLTRAHDELNLLRSLSGGTVRV